MTDHKNRKKKLIISYKNLTEELRELFKEAYPEGYREYLQKTIKTNGEPIFVVPLETDDTSYMIKFDVVIDTGLVEEDIDKDLYGDDEHETNDFAPISEAIEKEENGSNHTVGKMRHGALEEVFEGLPEDKKEFEIANADIDDEYGDRPEPDSYVDGDKEEEEDVEPTDEELLDIDALLEEADSGEGMLREENPPEEDRKPRKRKSTNPDITSVQAVGEAVKEARQAAAAKAMEKAPQKAEAPTKSATAKSAKTAGTAKPTAAKATASKAAKTATGKTTAPKKAIKPVATENTSKKTSAKQAVSHGATLQASSKTVKPKKEDSTPKTVKKAAPAKETPKKTTAKKKA